MSGRKLNRSVSKGKPELIRAARILLAEDDQEMRKLLSEPLRKVGYHVTECQTGQDLADRLHLFRPSGESAQFDLVISDIRMPSLTGLGALKIAGQREGLPPMILITAFGDEETHAEAYRLGAAAVFDKPFDIEVLLAEVADIMAHRFLSGP